MPSGEVEATINSDDRPQFEKLENSLLSVVTYCTDELFDWLTLKELAALNLTCKKLQQLTTDYFQRRYPMKCMKVGQVYGEYEIVYWSKNKSLQQFTQSIRNLVVLPTTECLRFLDLYHNKNVTSIAFYDGQIMEHDMEIIASILANVDIIEIQYGCIDAEFHDSVLKYCTRMKQLVIKYGFSECEKTGVANMWLMNTYPTLEHFHWSSAVLPEKLEIFFRQNPNIRSFSASVYTAISLLGFLLQTETIIDEIHIDLILELYEDESEGMELFRSTLDMLYARRQFKTLMLKFIFCSQLLYGEWAKLEYLIGAYIDFQYQHGSTKAISSLVHLKLLVLGINTILSPAKANILSKALVNLEEIYIQINSVHAITPFLRNACKLQRIYVYRMGTDNGFNTKIKRNFLTTLNMQRQTLQNACKTMVFLPDEAYIQMKCQSNDNMNCNLVEIQRSESHILRHPFAATKIRKDICELFEKY